MEELQQTRAVTNQSFEALCGHGVGKALERLSAADLIYVNGSNHPGLIWHEILELLVKKSGTALSKDKAHLSNVLNRAHNVAMGYPWLMWMILHLFKSGCASAEISWSVADGLVSFQQESQNERERSAAPLINSALLREYDRVESEAATVCFRLKSDIAVHISRLGLLPGALGSIICNYCLSDPVCPFTVMTRTRTTAIQPWWL